MLALVFWIDWHKTDMTRKSVEPVIKGSGGLTEHSNNSYVFLGLAGEEIITIIVFYIQWNSILVPMCILQVDASKGWLKP